MARMRHGPRFGGGGIERSGYLTAPQGARKLAPSPSGPNGRLRVVHPPGREVAAGWYVFCRSYFRGGSRLERVRGPFPTEGAATIEMAHWAELHRGQRFEVMLLA